MEPEKEFVGMANCFLCNKPKHLLLDRRMRKSFPREAVYDKEPCDKCKELMAQGVIIISVKDGETDHDNPYRTGGWWVVKDEAIKKAFSGDFLKSVLNKRVMFIEDQFADKFGLPRKNIG